MRIAYLILAHFQPNHVARLICRLDASGVWFFIHVDAKTDESSFRKAIGDMANVVFVTQRYDVNWGGYNMVRATLATLSAAFDFDQRFDRFTLLSGSDYLIKPFSSVLQAFDSDTEFMRVDRELVLSGEDYHDTYISVYWFMDSKDPSLKNLSGKMPRVKPLEHAPLFHGAQWWSLTRGCVEYVLGYVAANQKYCSFFEEVQCPDEIFFQTIVKRSPFASRLSHDFERAADPAVFAASSDHGCHYVDWFPVTGTRPKVLDLGDFEKLVRSNCLFARKFDQQESKDLIARLEETVLR